MTRRAFTTSVLVVLAAIGPAMGDAPTTTEVEKEIAEITDRAFLLNRKGDYAAAEPLFREAVAMAEKAFGAEHPNMADAVNNLVMLLLEKADYAPAEPLARRVVAIRERSLGPEHPRVGTALNNLASVLEGRGDYAAAEALFRRALAIAEKTQSGVYPAINNLAILLKKRGDYAAAEQLDRRALAIAEKTSGPEPRERVGRSLTNLAALLVENGDYATAEPLYRRALAILEKTLGPEHPDTVSALADMAGFLAMKGDSAAAEPLIRRALATREKTLGPQHPDVAKSLGQLGSLLMRRDDYAAAEPCLRRALAITEAAYGPEHPEVADSLSGLAVLLIMQGNVGAAEPLARRALAIREKAVGPEHPDVAASLDDLAFLLEEKGDYAAVEPLYRRALAIYEKAFGPEHPSVAVTLSNLAWMLVASGQSSAAVAVEQRAADINEKIASVLLATGSAREKAAFYFDQAGSTQALVSLHVQHRPDDDSAARLALTALLQRKGRLLEASADTVRALRRRAEPDDVRKLDQLASLGSELAARSLRGPLPGQTVGVHRAALDTLRARAEALESQLGSRYAALRPPSEPTTIETVQRRLASGSALVEMLRYQPVDPRSGWGKRRGTWHYVAYVIPASGAPGWTDLGAAKPIDQLVAEARKRLADADASYPVVARQLDERLMRPIRGLLGDAHDVYLAPDGPLNLVPFAALVDEQGRFLISTYRFTLLTSGRDLLRRDSQEAPRSGPAIVAAPDYGRVDRPEPEESTPSPRGRRSVDMRNVRFSLLPGADREGHELAGLLHRARLLTGAAATEAAVKKLRAPRVLHVATHGFFLQDGASVSPGTRGAKLLAEKREHGHAPDDPLLRSGLALAGANARRSGSEDGILTALEVSGLDLWGTKLVVLSACETGVGKVTGGDGVYGLRRALVLAGAESQVMSLWKVDDKATRLLMTDYYRRLVAGGGRSDALREAQLALLARPNTAHPFYWAAFIASGDQRSLDGNAPPPVR